MHKVTLITETKTFPAKDIYSAASASEAACLAYSILVGQIVSRGEVTPVPQTTTKFLITTDGTTVAHVVEHKAD